MQPLLATFASHWEPLVWFVLGIVVALGLVALLHPRRLTTLALGENGWVETSRGSSGLSTPFSGSFVALALSRLFGAAVLAAVAAVAYYVAQR
ncbi:MAG: hypothetical protein WD845_00545 [Pirellulales bacterium]